jgi:heme-degrading monooxygenase HmoA
MAGTHDRFAPNQLGTYQEIDVHLFHHRLDIGERPDDFAGASLVRLAHCHVRTNHQAHFIQAQTEVWNPGMTGAAGMCGGVFASRGASEFLVVSLWRSAVDHERYVSERFRGLRRRSGAGEDLASITGDLVELDPTWTVPAR